MSNENETPYVETMTADQLADAVREAHRDNDHGDVNHYCCRLTNRIADLERQLAEAEEAVDGLEKDRDHFYEQCEELEQLIAEAQRDLLTREEGGEWVSRCDHEDALAESVSKRDVARAVFYNVDGVTNNPSWQKDKLKALGITPDMAKEGE